MADRTSAEIFGEVFRYLAKQPQDSWTNEFAAYMWNMSFAYDFNSYQMCVDDELIKLGLAKMGVDPEYPGDDEVVIYAEPNGRFR